ncbi:ribbon-helix-helix domain-containing protein [Dyella sp.]|uniref:ribbon-helix-helix domain-containing protein n=1 Tax=Dyella sp. TaxID=1869338 RepID=UPI002ED35EAE
MEWKEMGETCILENFDMALVAPKSKSIRINGKGTCIRLENIYWILLQRMACVYGVSVNRLIATLDKEVQFSVGEVSNFTSLLRAIAVTESLSGEALLQRAPTLCTRQARFAEEV